MNDRKPPDRMTRLAEFAGVVAALITAVGVLIAYLSWQHPHSPVDAPKTNSPPADPKPEGGRPIEPENPPSDVRKPPTTGAKPPVATNDDLSPDQRAQLEANCAAGDSGMGYSPMGRAWSKSGRLVDCAALNGGEEVKSVDKASTTTTAQRSEIEWQELESQGTRKDLIVRVAREGHVQFGFDPPVKLHLQVVSRLGSPIGLLGIVTADRKYMNEWVLQTDKGECHAAASSVPSLPKVNTLPERDSTTPIQISTQGIDMWPVFSDCHFIGGPGMVASLRLVILFRADDKWWEEPYAGGQITLRL